MSNFQVQPIKLYIQDIYRANRSAENQYVYEIFGLSFKNVMIHGVVTSIYNTLAKTTNFELSDPTGTVQIYYDTTKSNSNVHDGFMKHLNANFASASKLRDENIVTMSLLMERIKKKKLNFTEGTYMSVVGDIFVDERSMRMISAFDCVETSLERDTVWLEELRYLYEKFYLWTKE